MNKNYCKSVVVEGYNKNDYITPIVNWETLYIAQNGMEDAEDYVLKLPSNYTARIVEKDIEDADLDNKHWEIYFGV